MKYSQSVIVLSLLSLVACGKGSGAGSGQAQQEKNNAREASDGIYHAHLRPLNPHANGYLPHGGATFSVKGDKLSVKTYLDDASGVSHRQSVHAGTECPGSSSDTNGDGFIDYQETLNAAGPVLIPLDGDLSSQEKGAEIYPTGPSFTYYQSGLISEMLNNLWEADASPADEFIKLGTGEGMRLVGRVVLIHGTSQNDLLPASLSGRGTDPGNLVFPVVCGTITPVL